MIGELDRLFLRRAVELAERGLHSTTPNPRVGCVIVRDGRVIGRGWHVRSGEAHAEVNAIADAGNDVEGATVYVSLEPCCHTGLQPPCTEALIRGRVRRVVGAMQDPDPRVAGKGYRALRAAGIVVDSVELPEAFQINAGFVKRLTVGRPLVRIKLAVSLDGRTAMASGESQWITSAEARADVQAWRARSCAIVTGIGTVLSDDPRLNVRDAAFDGGGGIRQPMIAVADTRGRTPAAARIFNAGARVVIVTGGRAPACHPHAEIVRQAGATVDLAELLSWLAGEGCNEVLVEAGATVAGTFLRDDLWDEAVIYLAPKLLGNEARPMADLTIERLASAVRGTIRDIKAVGADLRVVLAREL
ncbi:MAG: bifunctional diaminohydroxyphosphoribosylaminopyrimidine deaminase/5-amino-6-(5-phosphoribosylamino)uracil reductase RibD [Gammaproteobacteria bacterium]|nr:bifunctional diaminohydroxyphosphoribosylaminopyrimidine deaminase/5-amino-6-(5-phosphoribosylamino)uracil reductase RibD [Gammaproteobacteria bacterium]MYF30435.1 bifunctional diaminohydroxyphosphoribosylaminopyrimidine deaminase/5-amino-6-(5-phosphoribosylamino)uracil reductase RibD [Gammaproteobacteria bacterium]MYK47517.1 bifunctional diaminohydroxyphosphoribosylaminopyrimidine deaminase/5-amino-6-(5-phosphoribosylamino)uracil reductase RibD [Gammaproteobacteria bacterium]